MSELMNFKKHKDSQFEMRYLQLRALNPQTGTTVDLISSSNGRVSDRIELRPGEIAVYGFSQHAEQNGIAYAQSHGLIPLVTGATNNICAVCQLNMLKNGVMPSTGLRPGPLQGVFESNWDR
jgi:hypothetical protein